MEDWKKVKTFDVYDDFDINNIEDCDYGYEAPAAGANTKTKMAAEEQALKSVEKATDDIRKILRIVRTGTSPKYVYKSIVDKGGHGIEVMGPDVAEKLFKSVVIQGVPKIKIGGQMKEPTLWKFIEGRERLFKVQRLCFNSDKEDVFNTFSGYRYKAMESFDISLIQKHLDHWKNILCSGNDEQYQYLLKWCARLLTKPDCRNRTGLVLLSKQGTGKNTFFTDHLVNIIGEVYACYESNSNNIFGQFNKKIENKHLVVCNEMVDAETASQRQAISYDRLKSLMTDQTVSIRAMRTDAYDVDNVFNLIVVSNNDMPFRIEDEDRRLIFLDVSNQYAAIKDSAEAREDPEIQKKLTERKAYFDALLKEKDHPDFLATLYSYLLTQYDEDWDPEAQRPLTKAKELILQRSVDPLQVFIEDNIEEIVKGTWKATEAYAEYKVFCNQRGHKYISNYNNFVGDLRSKYDIINDRKDKKAGTCLFLTPEGEKRYAKLFKPQQVMPRWKQLMEFMEFIPENKMKAFESLLSELRSEEIPE